MDKPPISLHTFTVLSTAKKLQDPGPSTLPLPMLVKAATTSIPTIPCCLQQFQLLLAREPISNPVQHLITPPPSSQHDGYLPSHRSIADAPHMATTSTPFITLPSQTQTPPLMTCIPSSL